MGKNECERGRSPARKIKEGGVNVFCGGARSSNPNTVAGSLSPAIRNFYTSVRPSGDRSTKSRITKSVGIQGSRVQRTWKKLPTGDFTLKLFESRKFPGPEIAKIRPPVLNSARLISVSWNFSETKDRETFD